MIAPPLPWTVSSSAWQLFQSKKSFLISNPNLPWHKLRLFPPDLYLVNWEIDHHQLSNLLRVYLIPSSRWWIKILKRPDPSTEPWRTPSVTSPSGFSFIHLCPGCAVWWHLGWAAPSFSPALRSGWRACSSLNPLSGHSCRWWHNET